MEGRIFFIGNGHGYVALETSPEDGLYNDNGKTLQVRYTFQRRDIADFRLLKPGDRISFWIGEDPQGRQVAVEIAMLDPTLREKRLGQLQDPGKLLRGRIVKLKDTFGFLIREDTRGRYFFPGSDVAGFSFRQLRTGQIVTFEEGHIVDGSKNLRARDIMPVDAQEAAA